MVTTFLQIFLLWSVMKRAKCGMSAVKKKITSDRIRRDWSVELILWGLNWKKPSKLMQNSTVTTYHRYEGLHCTHAPIMSIFSVLSLLFIPSHRVVCFMLTDFELNSLLENVWRSTSFLKFRRSSTLCAWDFIQFKILYKMYFMDFCLSILWDFLDDTQKDSVLLNSVGFCRHSPVEFSGILQTMASSVSVSPPTITNEFV